MTLVVFRTKAELSAEQNLSAWIKFARDHHVLGAKFDWDAHVWDLTELVNKRAKGRVRYRLHFSSARDPGRSSRKKVDFLREPFMSFAKAVIAEKLRLDQVADYTKLLLALRAIEQALYAAGESSPVQMTALTLDAACREVASALVDSWSVARQLEYVAALVDSHRLSKRPLVWKSAIKWKRPGRVDHFDGGDEWRADKLPDIRAILALAEINRDSQSPIDRVVTSFAAMALFAPSRAAEILSLPVQCWATLEDGEDTISALRWLPAKGGDAMVKLPSGREFNEAAKTAITFLEGAGRSARIAAKWYEENPGKLFLPEGLEYLRDQALTKMEMAAILGAEGLDLSFSFDWGLERVGTCTDRARIVDPEAHGVGLYSFASFEEKVLAFLPSGFPFHDKPTGLKMSEALFVLPQHFMNPQKTTWCNVPQPISLSIINHQLGAHPQGLTVFSRNKKIAPDGKPWRITSHQFRHLLNTIAQAKYLSQSLIALWSGRADVKQNAAYDHASPEIYLEAYVHLAKASEEIPLTGPLQEKLESRRRLAPITVKELLSQELGSIHTTRFGICRHDYALTPCPRYKDCINCGENVFVKGDPNHQRVAQEQVQLLERSVADATRAEALGEAGAKKWLLQNEGRLARWKEVVRMHVDKGLSNGTVCTLPPPTYSQSAVGHAIASNALQSESSDA
ncbi:MAG: hypothetical protein JNN20_16185 [Betaproteobacteria bacterium]|nr:hypothetical protein [Betaproteobacteria bacterium]